MSKVQLVVLLSLLINVMAFNVAKKEMNHQWLQQQTQVWVKPVMPRTTSSSSSSFYMPRTTSRSPRNQLNQGCGDCKALESKLEKLQKNLEEMEKMKTDIEELKKLKEDSVSCQIGTSSNHGGITITKPQSYKSQKVWFKKQFSNPPTVIAALRHVVLGNQASNIFVFAENVTIDGFSLTYFWDKPEETKVDMSHMKASWIACQEPEMKYGRILPIE